MTLEQYAYAAEIAGVIIIIVTLIYLAIQTKQNTLASQASVRQAVLEEDRESIRQMVEFPGLNKRVNLTEEEDTRLQAYLIHFVRARENFWLQYQSGLLDEATWNSYRDPLVPVVFSSKFGREFWARPYISGLLVPGFVESVNEWVDTLDIHDREMMLPPIDTSE